MNVMLIPYKDMKGENIIKTFRFFYSDATSFDSQSPGSSFNIGTIAPVHLLQLKHRRYSLGRGRKGGFRNNHFKINANNTTEF